MITWRSVRFPRVPTSCRDQRPTEKKDLFCVINLRPTLFWHRLVFCCRSEKCKVWPKIRVPGSIWLFKSTRKRPIFMSWTTDLIFLSQISKSLKIMKMQELTKISSPKTNVTPSDILTKKTSFHIMSLKSFCKQMVEDHKNIKTDRKFKF